MKFNKLIRDKIPEIIKKRGGVTKIHVASEKEYWTKLKEKLLEEVKEFDQDETMEEIADILEIIDAICMFKKFSKTKLVAFQKKKRTERGAFKKKLILEETT